MKYCKDFAKKNFKLSQRILNNFFKYDLVDGGANFNFIGKTLIRQQ